MLVSTRGRYALRVVIDLAENANGGYIPMKDVAKSPAYLSESTSRKIMPLLTKGGLVEGVHGKGRRISAAEGASGLYVGGDFAADGGNSGAGQLRGALFGALRPGGRLPYSSHVAEAERAD